MYHFFAPEGEQADGTLIITGNDVKHITRVLRLSAGDKIAVSDNRDRNHICEIAETGPDFVRLKIISGEMPSTEMNRRISIFQGLPKSDKMDYIVTKCVELGAYSFVPVAMERSVVKLDEKKKEDRRLRWQAKAESAAKQSGRSRIPAVETVMDFTRAMAMAKKMDYLVVPYESADNMAKTRKLLNEIEKDASVAVFIGPEGGFSPSEIQMLKDAGAHIITLGPRILRTETAGMAFLAMGTLLWE